jgi:iron complex outermembrane receptor protein
MRPLPTPNRRSSLLLAILAALSGAPGVAAAADDERLPDIVVTAQRREQNLQDVGTSVTAFDANTLGRLGLSNVTDVAGQVPGLQFNQYGATVTIYNLRGVSQNDFSDHQEAPVAVYADDAYIASTGALAGSLYDLERVEVLRGPQGTLFGRNATGGLIHYISRAPSDTPEGYVQATAGNYGTLETEGALGGPLSDKWSGRFSFSTAKHDGYIRNRIGPAVNDQRQYAGRLQLRYHPSEAGDVRIKVYGLTNDNEVAGNYSWAASSAMIDPAGRGVFTPGATDFGGYANPSTDPFDQSEDRRGLFNRTIFGANVRVNWDLGGGVHLAAITDYLRLRKRYGEDSDVGPNALFNYDTGVHYRQFSQEVRLNGGTAPFRWIAGAYYLNYQTANFEKTVLPDLVDNPLFGGPVPYGSGYATLNLKTSSPSVFGQVEYDLAPAWTVIGGVRYTLDDKEYVYDYTCNVCGLDGGPYHLLYSRQNGFPDAKKSYHIPTGKLELDFKPHAGVLVYASVNRGAKGGGWSAPSSGYVNVDPAVTALPVVKLQYDQEKLTSYEVGFKSTLFDGLARLNGAAFYYDYKNYQGFFLEVATQIVENINAKVKGAELELAVAPVRGLNLQLGVSHLETRADNVPTPAGVLVTSELPQAPRYSVNAVARYEWPALAGRLSVELDGKWNSRQYLELVNAPVDLEASYAVLNARLGWTSGDGRVDLTAFARNLADKRYRIYNLDLSGFLGLNQGVYGPPRLYGLTAAYHWGM